MVYVPKYGCSDCLQTLGHEEHIHLKERSVEKIRNRTTCCPWKIVKRRWTNMISWWTWFICHILYGSMWAGTSKMLQLGGVRYPSISTWFKWRPCCVLAEIGIDYSSRMHKNWKPLSKRSVLDMSLIFQDLSHLRTVMRARIAFWCWAWKFLPAVVKGCKWTWWIQIERFLGCWGQKYPCFCFIVS